MPFFICVRYLTRYLTQREHLIMYFVINGEKTKSFDVKQEVPQGDSLSPILFLSFMCDIEEFFREHGAEGVKLGGILKVLLLALADDIVILAESPADVRLKLNVRKLNVAKKK